MFIFRLNCASESFNYGPQPVCFLLPGGNKEVVMSNISSEPTGASAVLREKKRPTVSTCRRAGRVSRFSLSPAPAVGALASLRISPSSHYTMEVCMSSAIPASPRQTH